MTSNSLPQNVVLCIDLYVYAEYSSDVGLPLLCFFLCLWLCAVSLSVHLCVSVLGAGSFPTIHCFIIPTMSLCHPCTLDLCPLTFPMQKKNRAMDSDDFRACLISMGYDLVGP